MRVGPGQNPAPPKSLAQQDLARYGFKIASALALARTAQRQRALRAQQPHAESAPKPGYWVKPVGPRAPSRWVGPKNPVPIPLSNQEGQAASLGLSTKDLRALVKSGAPVSKFLTSLGTETAGIGPGMYHLGGQFVHDPAGTTAQVAKATWHSFGRTIHHPIQQLENDPLGLVANASIFAAVPGRALATAAEAGRAGSLSDLAHAVIKPQAGLRDIKLPGGDTIPGGTASKNYGVAFLAKHGYDRIVEHAVNNPEGAIARALNHRLVGPEVHVGRLQRAQQRFEAAASTGVESKLARYSQGRMMLRGKKLSGPEEKALQIHASGQSPQVWAQMEQNALHLGAKNPTQLRLTEAAHQHFNPDGTLNAKLAPIANEMRQATLERQALREGRGAATPESHLYRLGALSLAVKHGAEGFAGESPVQELQRLAKITKPSGADLARIDELHAHLVQEGQRVDAAGGHYLPLESNRRAFLGQRPSTSVSLRKGTSKAPPRTPKDYQFGGALLRSGAYRSNATQLAARGLSREKLLAQATANYERLWKQASPTVEGAGGEQFAHPIRKTLQIPDHLKETQNALAAPIFRKGETTDSVMKQLWEHNSRPPAPHEDVRYIDRRRLGPLKPYEPLLGKAGEALDRANQVARGGRFLGPQYAVKWGPQNAVVVATHQGPMVLRNGAKLVRAMHRLDPVTYEKFAALSGSGAARTLGGETRFLHGPITKAAEFFHRAVDHIPRMLVSMHEAHLRGFTKPDQWKALVNGEATTVRGKALDAGQVKRLQQEIFQRGNKEAIDYGAQTNVERATLKKLFVSWPWTGSASRWMARFPIEHPYQGALYSQAGQEGRKQLAKYFDQHGQGQVPGSLEASITRHPNAKGIATAIDTSFLNPGETLGGLAEGVQGMLSGGKYAGKLSSEYAPVSSAVIGKLAGSSHPFRKLENAQPFGALNLARGKGPKTIVGGPKAGLERWGGLPTEQINVPAAAKAAETKYMAGLSPTDKVTERFTQHHKQLEQVLKASGSTLTPELQGRLSLRYERAMARARLGGTGRLTPQQRLQADLSVLVEHKWMKPGEMTAALNRAKTASPADFQHVFTYLTENYFDRRGELSAAYKWLRDNGHPTMKLP